MKTLLLNYVYHSPVGHTVEALRYTKGLATANPDVEVHVALSDYGASELTQGCPWIAGTYPIRLTDFQDPRSGSHALDHLPKDWDYIIGDDLEAINEVFDPAYYLPQELVTNAQLRRYFEQTSATLNARLGKGTIGHPRQFPAGLGYLPQAQVALSIPATNRLFADRYAHDGPKICILLGGSDGYYRYPDVSSWIDIIAALRQSFHGVRFYLTGVRKSGVDRTYTAGYSDQAIEEILSSGPDVVDCYDIGLWNQIALLETCGAFLSPHTGFGFLAPCVGTPWLTISGGHWPEYFFNHVPFYSVFPDNPEFPYRAKLYPRGSVSKLPCMRSENLDRKIPEIVEAMGLLMSDDFTYEAAVVRHRDNIARANIDRRFVPQPTDPFLASF